MTQEDKELLLKDLCTRLPYGVFLKIGEYSDYTLQGIVHSNVNKPLLVKCNGSDFECSIEVVRPYLRPMSSMAEEEKHKLLKFGAVTCLENGAVVDVSCVGFERHADIQDYLNACYLDYRGLIPMNLALEAPKEMYDLKEK